MTAVFSFSEYCSFYVSPELLKRPLSSTFYTDFNILKTIRKTFSNNSPLYCSQKEKNNQTKETIE